MLDHSSQLKRNKINFYVSQEKIEDYSMLSARLISETMNKSTSALPNISLNENDNNIEDESNESVDIDKLKLSNVYEKKVGKVKCGLCGHYYSKSSVTFRVPNNRIINLLKKWNIVNDGLRYQSPSYLYAFKKVCVFCSQFFSIDDINDIKEINNSSIKLHRSIISEFSEPRINTSHSHRSMFNQSTLQDIKSIIETTENKSNIFNKVTTKIIRSDIALNQQCYQSSTSDYYIASNAVTEPYINPSKTRREVDPWWEIDLGINRNILQIKIIFQCNYRQVFDVSIMLLNEPIGFNDPFLDSVLQKCFLSTNINKTTSNTAEVFDWDLPINSNSKAIRVQMKGIHTLCIKEFHVYQGDNLPINCNDQNNNEKQVSDDLYFRSMSPNDLKMKLSSMISPIQRRKQIHSFGSNELDKLKFDDVNDFISHISQRYELMNNWLEKVKEFCNSFLIPEIIALYKVIFLYCIENEYNNNEYIIFQDKDLTEDSLLMNDPRATFKSIIERLRTVLRWIQSRRHVQTLGPLTYNEYLNAFSKDSEETLYRLQVEFKKIERYYEESSPSRRSASKNSRRKDMQYKGCSWSQFIIIMSLLCSNQTSRIPAVAYGIGHDDNTEPIIIRNINTSESNLSSQSIYRRPTISEATNLSSTFLTSSTNDSSENVISSRPSTSYDNMPHSQPLLTKKKSALTQAHLRKKLHKSKRNMLALIDETNENSSNDLSSKSKDSDIMELFDISPSNNDNNKSNSPKSISIRPTTNSNRPKTTALSGSHSNMNLSSSLSMISYKSNQKSPIKINKLNQLNLLSKSLGNDLNKTENLLSNLSQLKLQSFKNKLNKEIEFPKFLTGDFTTLRKFQNRQPSTSNSISKDSESIDGLESTSGSVHLEEVNKLLKEPSVSTIHHSSMNSPAYSPRSNISIKPLDESNYPNINLNSAINTTLKSTRNTIIHPSMINDDIIEDDNIKSNDVMVVSILKICVLCRLKYPKEATNRVLAKHVTNLRNYLKMHSESHNTNTLSSPNTHDDEISINTTDQNDHNNIDDNLEQEQEQDIAMYNLVRVCLFCSQYFDPDYLDNEGFPKIEPIKKKEEGILASISSKYHDGELVPFIDLRYPTLSKTSSMILFDARAIKSREFAKRATVFSNNSMNKSMISIATS